MPASGRHEHSAANIHRLLGDATGSVVGRATISPAVGQQVVAVHRHPGERPRTFSMKVSSLKIEPEHVMSPDGGTHVRLSTSIVASPTRETPINPPVEWRTSLSHDDLHRHSDSTVAVGED